MDFMKFMRVLNSSKRYEMDCEGHLTITDYYTGEEVTLDLTQMDEEMFAQLKVEDEDEYDEYDEEEDD
jgi:hypothetical protein